MEKTIQNKPLNPTVFVQPKVPLLKSTSAKEWPSRHSADSGAYAYAHSDRLKTPAFRRRSLAPYVPLRFYPSESASERA